MTQPRFEIIEKDWYKRRRKGAEPRPISVAIADYQATEQHLCNMQVEFDDGSAQTLLGRVIRNKITGQWTVDGMQVAVRVLD